MTGWRIGYILGNDEFIECLQNVHEHLNICPISFGQEGAIKAYTEDIKEVKGMFREYKMRKDYIVDYLNKLDKVSFYEPQGAFYIFLNVGELGINGSEFCLELLKQKGVALSPGDSFGEEWTDYVRMTFCCSMEDIIEGMYLIKEYIDSKIN